MTEHGEIRVGTHGGFTVVELRGRFGLTETQELSEVLEALVTQETPNVAFDLRDLVYMGSRAIGVLMQARGEAQSRGGRLILGNLQPAVAKVIRMNCLDEVFEVVEDLDAMLQGSEKFLESVERLLKRSEEAREKREE